MKNIRKLMSQRSSRKDEDHTLSFAALGSKMKPQMSATEFVVFVGFVRHSRVYLEFGSGGSTYIATQLVMERVISVDSSKEWLKNVREACLGEECRIKPDLFLADIGPVGAWGTPVNDLSFRPQWPKYHEAIWLEPLIADADLYFIDGRFRVACFVQILLHRRADALIMIHDFSSRSQYHVIREVAREIASVGDPSVFMASADVARERLYEILDEYRFDSE
jgi:hypothetical protein